MRGVFKICYGYGCKHEIPYDGGCRKKPYDICQAMVADDDDLDQAEADHLDEVTDAYYNEWEDQNEYDKNHN